MPFRSLQDGNFIQDGLVRDYSKKYSNVIGGRQKISVNRPGGPEEQPFRIIGVVTIVAILLGVVSSIWFGGALRDGLERLGKGKQENIELSAAKVRLSAEKEALLQQQIIEAAAEGLGLFPPSENQKRKP